MSIAAEHNANTPIRIFISSPSDVEEERKKARLVTSDLQSKLFPDLSLEIVMWEDLLLPATASFQETIDHIITSKPIDIAIFILWSRLGSPLDASFAKPDGTPYLSGTEREFDVMLTAFEQSGGVRPIIMFYRRKDEDGWKKRITRSTGDDIADMLSQVQSVDRFMTQQFRDKHGYFSRAYHSYSEPAEFAHFFKIHLKQALEQRLGSSSIVKQWLDAPYRGLSVFELEHSAIFFGRENERCQLQAKLIEQRKAGTAFVVIVGASGSGKSSLARAGIAADLTQSCYEEDVKEYRQCTVIPGTLKDDLIFGLVRILIANFPLSGIDEEVQRDVAKGLRDEPGGAILVIKQWIRTESQAIGGNVKLLLICDQMEELWTGASISVEDRECFLKVLDVLCRSGDITILGTLRSDFYAQAQQSQTFLDMKGEHGHFDLLPPSTVALHRLITEPAKMSGLTFERNELTGQSLDQTILEDALRGSSILPLLQYTLLELFESRDELKNVLTFAAYTALGGVEGALGKRASNIFQRLPAHVKSALPEILPLLVTVDVDGEQSPVRRRALLSELQSSTSRKALTDALIAARFLTSDEENQIPIASITHEALLSRWGEISSWITTNRESLRLLARIEQQEQRWLQGNRHASLLLPAGLPLEEGRKLISESPELLVNRIKIRDYIDQSLEHSTKQNQRMRSLRLAIVAVLLLLSITASTIGVYAWLQRQDAIAATRDTDKKNQELQSAKGELQNAFSGLSESRARQFTASAWRHHDEGDPEAAMALMAQALEIPTDDEKLNQLNKQRFHWLWRQRPILSVWNDARFAEFGPNGELVVAEDNGTLGMWSSDGMILKRLFRGHNSPILCVSFSESGNQFVSCSADGNVSVWDIQNSEPLVQYQLQDVVRAGFVGEGKIWTATKSGLFRHIAVGKTVNNVTAEFSSLGILNDIDTKSRIAIVQKDDQFLAVSLDSPSILATFPQNATHPKVLDKGLRVAFVADKRLTIRKKDSTQTISLRLPNNCVDFDLSSDAAQAIVLRHVSPNEKIPYDRAQVELTRVNDGFLFQKQDIPIRPNMVRLSPDGHLVFVGGIGIIDACPAFVILDATSLQPLSGLVRIPTDNQLLGIGSRARSQTGIEIGIRWSNEGRLLTHRYNNFSSCLWDLNPNLNDAKFRISKSGIHSGAFLDSQTLRIWDSTAAFNFNLANQSITPIRDLRVDSIEIEEFVPSTVSETWTLPYTTSIGERSQFERTETKFVIKTRTYSRKADSESRFAIFDRVRKNHLSQNGASRISIPGQGINFIGFYVDRYVVVADESNCVARVWDSLGNSYITPPLVHKHRLVRAIFSDDATSLVTISSPTANQFTGGEEQQYARVWDLASGIPITSEWLHPAHEEFFSPDNRFVACISSDSAMVVDVGIESPLSPRQASTLSQVAATRTVDPNGELSRASLDQLEALCTSSRSRLLLDSKDVSDLVLYDNMAWFAKRARQTGSSEILKSAYLLAEKLSTRATPQPYCFEILGLYHANRGDRQQALEAWKTLKRKSTTILIGLAILSLCSNDLAEYQATLLELSNRAQNETDGRVINAIGWIAVAHPNSPEVYRRILDAVNRERNIPNTDDHNLEDAIRMRLGQVDDKYPSPWSSDSYENSICDLLRCGFKYQTTKGTKDAEMSMSVFHYFKNAALNSKRSKLLNLRLDLEWMFPLIAERIAKEFEDEKLKGFRIPEDFKPSSGDTFSSEVPVLEDATPRSVPTARDIALQLLEEGLDLARSNLKPDSSESVERRKLKLAAATEKIEKALEVQGEIDPGLKALLYNNLGFVTRNRSGYLSGDEQFAMLRKSLNSFDRSLQIVTEVSTPKYWKNAHWGKSTTQRMLVDMTDDKDLKKQLLRDALLGLANAQRITLSSNINEWSLLRQEEIEYRAYLIQLSDAKTKVSLRADNASAIDELLKLSDADEVVSKLASKLSAHAEFEEVERLLSNWLKSHPKDVGNHLNYLESVFCNKKWAYCIERSQEISDLIDNSDIPRGRLLRLLFEFFSLEMAEHPELSSKLLPDLIKEFETAESDSMVWSWSEVIKMFESLDQAETATGKTVLALVNALDDYDIKLVREVLAHRAQN